MSLLESFGALCAIYLSFKFVWIFVETSLLMRRDYVIEALTWKERLKDFTSTFFHLWIFAFWHVWLDLTLKDD